MQLVESIKEYYQKIPKVFKNKYAVTLIAFTIWLTFFDRNDLISQYKLTMQLKELEDKMVYYKEQLEEVKKTQKELFTDQSSIEKFAREKYWMKRDNEDVFIIVEE